MTATRKPLPTGPEAREVAGHVAVALADLRSALAKQRHPLPEGVLQLEALFMGWARGSAAQAAQPQPPVMPRLLLTFDEVADTLAVSLSSVRRLVDAGDLPAVGVMRQRRIRVVDLEAYVAGLGP